MQILIPMFYAETGYFSSTSSSFGVSAWELDGDGNLQPRNGITGDYGLWTTTATEISPRNTTSDIDLYFKYDANSDVTPKTDGEITVTQLLVQIPNFSYATSSEYTQSFEFRKAISPDLDEYAKFNDDFFVGFAYENVDAVYNKGVLLSSDTWFANADNRIVLKSSDEQNYSSASIKPVLNSYGGAVGIGTYPCNSVKPSPVVTTGEKCLIKYDNDNSYKYHYIDVSGSEIQKIQNITHGILIDVSDFKTMEYKENKDYRQTKVTQTLRGEITWDGYSQSSTTKTFTLEFNNTTEDEKDKIIYLFKLGKGGLPIWVIEDEDDTDTWSMVKMTTANVTEPYDKMFNISITCEEF